MSYARFAIYFLPPEGPLADFGAAWLGWNSAAGCEVAQLDVPGLAEITKTPRKYGFHGTLKPPFRLRAGQTREALEGAVANLADGLAPATCDGLRAAPLGRFLALTPRGDTQGLGRVAAACLRDLDEFRARPTTAELARRRKARLSPRQEALLTQWGYPYVLDEFRFHMTLTDRLPEGAVAGWMESLEQHLPALPAPFALSQIALCGERPDGRFELIRRYDLKG